MSVSVVEPVEGGGMPPGGEAATCWDPRDCDRNRWFPAWGIEKIQDPFAPQAIRPGWEHALAQADDLVRNATRATGNMGKNAYFADLHTQAADIRRAAGAWSECTPNFIALSRYYLAAGNRKATEAYLHKLMFTCEHADGPDAKVDILCFIADTYVKLEMLDAASGFIGKAARVLEAADRTTHARASVRLGISSGILDSAWAVARPLEVRRPRTGGKGRRPTVPVEFRNRTLAPPSGEGPSSELHRCGLDMLMSVPGTDGECPYWVAERVVDGRYQTSVLVNWSGRAMLAAEVMLKYSRLNPAGTEGPSSVVLHVTCALEAFINSVCHHIREAGPYAWRQHALPPHIFDDQEQHYKKSILDNWKIIGSNLFGEGWLPKGKLEDFKLLLHIRNSLVHFKGENQERFGENRLKYRLFEQSSFLDRMGKSPTPWVDRILTLELAIWCVDLGHYLIATFRENYPRWLAEQQAMLELNDCMSDHECAGDWPDDDDTGTNGPTKVALDVGMATLSSLRNLARNDQAIAIAD